MFPDKARAELTPAIELCKQIQDRVWEATKQLEYFATTAKANQPKITAQISLVKDVDKLVKEILHKLAMGDKL